MLWVATGFAHEAARRTHGLRSVEGAIGDQEYRDLRIASAREERAATTATLPSSSSPFARDERNEIVALMPEREDAVETWSARESSAQ